MATLPDEMLERLYETAASPDEWPAIFTDIARYLDATGLGILDSRAGEVRFLACGDTTDLRAQSAYEDYYGGLDPTIQAVSRLKTGQIEGIFQRPDLQRQAGSEFFEDWAIPNGMGSPIYGVLDRRNARTTWLVAAYPQKTPIAVLKRRKEAMDRAWPAISRFVRLARKFHEREQELHSLRSSLDALPVGLVIVDEALRTRAANRLAGQMDFDEHGLRIRSGRLECDRAAVTAELRRLVSEALDPVARMMNSVAEPLVLSLSDHCNIVVECLPCPAAFSGLERDRTALLLVRRAMPATLRDVSAFARTYGLTKAETGIVFEIIRGLGIDNAALALGISRSTVRVHLQRVFEKCEVHSQAELTALAYRHRSLSGNGESL